MVCPALVAAEGNRQDERRCEPRRQPEENPIPWISPDVVSSAPGGSMLPAPRKRYATAASERRTIPAIAVLERAKRSAENERKRADAGGTREEGDVHQPSEVTQRILAGRVAVVELGSRAWRSAIKTKQSSDPAIADEPTR